MKKSLSCADMGISSCTFEARSEKTDEIKDAIATHFAKVHQKDASQMSDKQRSDMDRMMDQKIK